MIDTSHTIRIYVVCVNDCIAPFVNLYYRVSSLKEQKERLVTLQLHLGDEIIDIGTRNEELSGRIAFIQQKCRSLENQVTSLLCRQEGQSPILSQAEEWMRDELEGFDSHMVIMHQKIIEVCLCVG